MDAKPGKEQGTLRIHPALTGKNVIASKDAHGVEFFRAMIEQKQGVIRYWWINQALGETTAREKIVAFDYLKEWDWVIAAGSYRDELNTEGVFLAAMPCWWLPGSRRWSWSPLSSLCCRAGCRVRCRKQYAVTNLLAAGDFRNIHGMEAERQQTENE